MKPLSRHSVHKGRQAKKFRKNVSRTKAANLSVNPMRGGWRM